MGGISPLYGTVTPTPSVVPISDGSGWLNAWIESQFDLKSVPGYIAFCNYQKDFSNYGIGRNFSLDGVDWWRCGSDPLIPPSSGWESNACAAPNAVIVDNVIYLYYSGYNGTAYQIGVAISTDYGRTFIKHSGNPVIPLGGAGSFDEKGAAYCGVVYDRDETNAAKQWKMWYGSLNASGKHQLAYAYSGDGLNWTKFGVVLTTGSAGEFDDNQLECGGGPIKVADTWYWNYSGNHSYAGNTRWNGGLATFTDPEGTYTKHGQNLFSLTTRKGSLTADTALGSAVVTVSDTSVFSVNEPVLLGGLVARPMLSRILSIDSSTQITLRDTAPRAYQTADNAALASVYSWSMGSRNLVRENGRWIAPITVFQQLQDVSTAYLTELCAWAYCDGPIPVGPWVIDLPRGVAIEPEQALNGNLSNENLNIHPLRFDPSEYTSEWATETPTKVIVRTRRTNLVGITALYGYQVFGIVSTVAGSPNVVGYGTRFLSQFEPGDRIWVNGVEVRRVLSVTDDTHLTTVGNFTTTNTNSTYVVQPFLLRIDKANGTPELLLQDDGLLNLANVQNYSDGSAAVAAGLLVGDVYRNGDVLQIVH